MSLPLRGKTRETRGVVPRAYDGLELPHPHTPVTSASAPASSSSRHTESSALCATEGFSLENFTLTETLCD